MYRRLLDAMTVLLAGLIAGAVSGAWWINRRLDDPVLSIGYKQVEIPALTSTLVPLGLLTTGLALLTVVQSRRQRARLMLALVGALSLVAMGLLTRFALFPLNSQIMAWSAQTPPADWRAIRDQWNLAHGLRTMCGLVGFSTLLLGALVPERQPLTAGIDARTDHHPAASSPSV